MRANVAIALMMLTVAGAARAEMAAPDRPVFSAGIENDAYGQPSTDRFFTHGTRFALRHGSSDTPFWHDALAWVPLLPADAKLSHETGLMQLIFTPSVINGLEVAPGDRPYAGLLAGTMAVTATAPDGRRQDQISLTLGIIGPASLAGPTQKLVHRVRDLQKPLGWATQLGTEPAVNLAWRRSWRFAAPMASFSPHVGAAIGNLYDYAAVGATVQLGAGLDEQRGAALEPFSGGIAALPKTNRLLVNINFGVEGRAVARNLFLDGNSFTNGRGVDKQTLVGDAFAGVSMRWQGLRLSLRHVWRSKEYHGQPGIQRFAAITLDVRL